jgi:5-methylcytosine-specific restriction protein A
MQPPRFGRQSDPRKPWQPTTARLRPVVERKRGRAGQRDRAQVLAEEPFCRSCLGRGLEVGSNEVDHIVPLSEGGSDERSNKQALCVPCHAAKSANERATARTTARTHRT